MTDPLVYAATLIGPLMTILVLPIFCWLDWKTRNLPDKYLCLYLLGASPSILLYAFGLPYTYFIISLVACAVWVIIRKTGAWGGGDTKFLMVFSMVCPLNPLNLFQKGFQFMFIIVLAGVLMIWAGFIAHDRKDVPMMIPIAVAVVAAWLIGVLL